MVRERARFARKQVRNVRLAQGTVLGSRTKANGAITWGGALADGAVAQGRTQTNGTVAWGGTAEAQEFGQHFNLAGACGSGVAMAGTNGFLTRRLSGETTKGEELAISIRTL